MISPHQLLNIIHKQHSKQFIGKKEIVPITADRELSVTIT